MTDKPRFILELRFTETGARVAVQEPALLTDKVMGQAYSLIDGFLMDMIDDLVPGITDEHYRELFIELCYKLVYREITTLDSFPTWEENFKERLGTRKRGPRVERKTYG